MSLMDLLRMLTLVFNIGGLAECRIEIDEGRGREISDERLASCLPCSFLVIWIAL